MVSLPHSRIPCLCRDTLTLFSSFTTLFLFVGALFSVAAALDSLFCLCGSLLFNSLYPISLEFGFRGFVFILGSVILLIPLILTWWVSLSTLLGKSQFRVIFLAANVELCTFAYGIGKSVSADIIVCTFCFIIAYIFSWGKNKVKQQLTLKAWQVK